MKNVYDDINQSIPLVVDNLNEITKWINIIDDTKSLSKENRKTIGEKYRQEPDWYKIITDTIQNNLNHPNILINHHVFYNIKYQGCLILNGKKPTASREITENDMTKIQKYLLKDFIFWFDCTHDEQEYFSLKVIKKNFQIIDIVNVKGLNDDNIVDVVVKIVKMCCLIKKIVDQADHLYKHFDKQPIENNNLEAMIEFVKLDISRQTLKTIENLGVFKCFEYAMDDNYFKFTGSEYNQVSDWDHVIRKTIENYFDFYNKHNIFIDRDVGDKRFRVDFMVKTTRTNCLLIIGEEKKTKSNEDLAKNDLIKKKQFYVNEDFLFCYAANGYEFQLFLYHKDLKNNKEPLKNICEVLDIRKRKDRMSVVCKLINICRILHAKI